MHVREGQDFLGPTNGAMGYSVPAAIGAKIVFPERTVVAFVGDGGFLMTGQEIATAFHHGSTRSSWCSTTRCTAPSACTRNAPIPAASPATALTNPDFAKFIESFGGHGEIVEATDQLVPAFKRAVASGKPAVIEVRTNPEQVTNRSTITQLRAQAAKA